MLLRGGHYSQIVKSSCKQLLSVVTLNGFSMVYMKKKRKKDQFRGVVTFMNYQKVSKNVVTFGGRGGGGGGGG